MNLDPISHKDWRCTKPEPRRFPQDDGSTFLRCPDCLRTGTVPAPRHASTEAREPSGISLVHWPWLLNVAARRRIPVAYVNRHGFLTVWRPGTPIPTDSPMHRASVLAEGAQR